MYLLSIVMGLFLVVPISAQDISSFSQIENVLSLRDPFAVPYKIKKKSGPRGNLSSVISSEKGYYSNEVNTSNLRLNTLSIVGLFIGKNRRALVRTGNSKSIITLREGMSIGPEKSVLKAILPGGLVFVKKDKNPYGQEEYQEVLIPFSR